MKKIFFILILFLVPMVVKANENYYDINVEKSEKVILKINSKSEKIYGMSAKITWDKNSLEINRCEGNNNYEVNVHNDLIVIDNAVAFNNVNIAVCYFDIKNETNTAISLGNVDVSIEKKIQSYFKNEKYEEDTKYVENPKTTAQNILLIVIVMFIFLVILIYGKKKAKLLSLFLIILIPISSMAFNNEKKYTLDKVNQIRDILLKKQTDDMVYDIYEDKKINIDDLIIYKILANKPNVNVDVEKGTKGDEYYSSVKYKVIYDSLSKIEKASYCITEKEECNSFDKELNIEQSNVEINLPSNKKAQKICIYLKNELGFENIICDNEKYFVDNETPKLELKESVIKVGADDNYNLESNIKSYEFGISGGSVTCSLLDDLKVGDNNASCIAKGNNGLETKKTFIINKSNTLNARAIFFGDSITDGWNEYEGNIDSWANLIGKNYDLREYLNCGNGGATISDSNNNTIIKVINGTLSPGKCPLDKYNEFNKSKVDYVILSGGINDINWGNLPDGTFDSNNFNGSYNLSTNAGSIENYLYLITTKYPGARIGYIITTYTPNYTERYNEQRQKEYFTLLKNILNKWKIPYFELNSISELQNGANLTYISDTVHPNRAGYNLITPYIYDWMQILPVYSR